MRQSHTDKITIHTDAARGEHVSGLGYIIQGEISRKGRKVLLGEYTSMEAELHALLEAVRVASFDSDARSECVVRTDCEPLVRKIRASENERDDWEQYRRSATWLLDKFDDWDVQYVFRSNNQDAHELAREALFEGRERLKYGDD